MASDPTGSASGKSGKTNTPDGLFGRSVDSMELLIVLLPVLAFAGSGLVLQSVRRGGFIAAGAITLVAGSCFGYYFQHAQLGPLPLSSERLLVFLMAIAYLICRGKQVGVDPKVVRKVDILVLLLIAVLTVSAFTHDWKADRLQPVSRLALLWIMPAVLYWIMRQSRIGEAELRITHITLAIFGVYLSITAWAETQSLTWMIFPRYISSSQFSEFFGRGRGPFLNPVGNGLFMLAGMGATMLAWPRSGVKGRLLILLAMPIYAIGIYSTYTRSIWASAVVVGFASLLSLLPARVRVPAFACSVILVVGGLATQWNSLMSFKRDRDLDAATTLDSVKLRPILGYVAWKMFEDHPFVGCGYGQYSHQVKAYTYDRGTPLQVTRARHYVPHNVIFAVATETGLLGLVPFLLMFGYWLADCWRLLRAPFMPASARAHGLLTGVFLIAFVINGLAHEVTLIAMCNMLLFFLCGLSTGIATRQLSRRSIGLSSYRSAANRRALPRVPQTPATAQGM